MAAEPPPQADQESIPINPDLPWQTTYRALLGAVKVGTSKSVKRIEGVDGMTVGQLRSAIQNGGRFVVFPYAISLIVITLRRASPITFMPAGTGRVVKGLPYLLISLLLGWWGIPWGFIFTPTCIVANLKGGRDVTGAIAGPLIEHSLTSAAQRR